MHLIGELRASAPQLLVLLLESVQLLLPLGRLLLLHTVTAQSTVLYCTVLLSDSYDSYNRIETRAARLGLVCKESLGISVHY